MLLASLLVAVPAATLTLAGVGHGADEPQVAKPDVPFCPLPEEMRTLIGNGFYKGRSAEVFAVARGDSVGSWSGSPEPTGAANTWPWPGLPEASDGAYLKVPVLLWGDRIAHREAPFDAPLSSVAPTMAGAMGFDRPHPEVRSGAALDRIVGPGKPPRLVLMIGIKGLDLADLEDARRWRALLRLGKEGLLSDGDPKALPSDSAATLTTVGVGALPSEHGITGSVVRNDNGELVQAWGNGSPGSTLATLGDDLLQSEPAAMAGMVATSQQDRGLIGDGWYLDGRVPDFEVVRGKQVPTAFERLLATGYGTDDTPDLVAAAIPVGGADRVLGELLDAAEAASGGRLTVAVFGTGSGGPARIDAIQADEIVREVEQRTGVPGIVSLAVSGAFFMDEEVAAETETSSGQVVEALKRIRGPDGKLVFEDAFPAFSIQFARYC